MLSTLFSPSLSLSKYTTNATTKRSKILMAVEARHLNLFPQQLMIQDRDFMNPMNQGNAYASQQMRFLGFPHGGAALPENQSSFYQPIICEAKTSVNTGSDLTYNNVCASRKRSRDSINQLYTNATNFPVKNNGVSNLASLGGEEILPHIQQYQLEIDALISQHTKKIRLELEERQKQQARILAAAIGEGMMKKLKEKDEQIQRMGKLNLVLQEKVKSLYVENQLWRDMAQTNEATANSLRTNLEQVLLNAGAAEERRVAAEEDVESCCGSSGHGGDDYLQEKNEGHSDSFNDRLCRRCGDREASVLLLPCRHLCLCNVCGSGSHHLQTCPVCDSSMTATLHVNMSS